jgi:hypothetical protein
MKNLTTFLLTALLFSKIANAQCPPGAFAYQSTYSQCASGCGVLLLGWPEGVQVNIYGGAPLNIVTSTIISGTFGGPGTGDAFTCVPCNTPLVFASSAPGAVSGCVIATIGIVPVKFMQFNVGMESNGRVQLRWQVAQETAPVIYTIQKSTDGRTYTDITEVSSKAENRGNYSQWLQEANTGGYYRIKAKEITGEVTLSSTVWMKKSNDASIAVYPNPTQNEFNLSIPNQSLPARLSVFNAHGQLLKQQIITATANAIINTFPKGIYTLKIETASKQTSVHRLIKN